MQGGAPATDPAKLGLSPGALAHAAAVHSPPPLGQWNAGSAHPLIAGLAQRQLELSQSPFTGSAFSGSEASSPVSELGSRRAFGHNSHAFGTGSD